MSTKQKIADVVRKLRVLYPNSYQTDLDGEKILNETFCEHLTPYTDEAIDLAVKEAIKNAGHFAPTIGDIMGVLRKIDEAGKPSESKLWSQLNIACNMVTNRGQVAAIWNNLHPILQSYCGSPSRLIAIANMNLDDFDTFERQKFAKTYPTLLERENLGNYKQLPNGKPQNIKEILEDSDGI